MINVKRTVYGLELYRAGTQHAADRLCTCDDLQKAERMIVWLTALDSLVPLDEVLAAKKAIPTLVPPGV